MMSHLQMHGVRAWLPDVLDGTPGSCTVVAIVPQGVRGPPGLLEHPITSPPTEALLLSWIWGHSSACTPRETSPDQNLHEAEDRQSRSLWQPSPVCRLHRQGPAWSMRLPGEAWWGLGEYCRLGEECREEGLLWDACPRGTGPGGVWGKKGDRAGTGTVCTL